MKLGLSICFTVLLLSLKSDVFAQSKTEYSEYRNGKVTVVDSATNQVIERVPVPELIERHKQLPESEKDQKDEKVYQLMKQAPRPNDRY